MNGTPDSDLGIYTYDPAANASIASTTSTRAARRRSRRLADDKSITHPFSFTDNGKTVIRTLNVWQGVINAYTWRTEFSTDNGADVDAQGLGKVSTIALRAW